MYSSEAIDVENYYYDANSVTHIGNDAVAYMILHVFSTPQLQKAELGSLKRFKKPNQKIEPDFRKYGASVELLVWNLSGLYGGSIYYKVLDDKQNILNGKSFPYGIKTSKEITKSNIRNILMSPGLNPLNTNSFTFVSLVSALEDPKNPVPMTKQIHTTDRLIESEKRWVDLGKITGKQFYYNPYSIKQYSKFKFSILMRHAISYPAWYTILKSEWKNHILPYNIYTVSLIDKANKKAMSLSELYCGVDGQKIVQYNRFAEMEQVEAGQFDNLPWTPIDEGSAASKILEDLSIRRDAAKQKSLIKLELQPPYFNNKESL